MPRDDDTTQELRHSDHGGPTLTSTMHELACEVSALRQEMRDFRELVKDLRGQVHDLRDKSTAKDEQVVVLRTQFKVLWAVAGTAGAAGLGALVLEIIRLLQHGVTP